jgi:hypothetical protein
VSGMMIPPLAFSFASIRLMRTRSFRGLTFISATSLLSNKLILKKLGKFC